MGAGLQGRLAFSGGHGEGGFGVGVDDERLRLRRRSVSEKLDLQEIHAELDIEFLEFAFLIEVADGAILFFESPQVADIADELPALGVGFAGRRVLFVEHFTEPISAHVGGGKVFNGFENGFDEEVDGFDADGNGGSLEVGDAVVGADHRQVGEDVQSHLLEVQELKHVAFLDDVFEQVFDGQTAEVVVPKELDGEFDLVKLRWES